MYENDPKISRFVTAHFIAADSATFNKVLPYPPPIVYKMPLIDRLNFGSIEDIQTNKYREYRLESYKFSKFGKQQIAIYREVLK